MTFHLLLRKVSTAFSFLSGLRRIDKRHTLNTRTIDDIDDDDDDDDDDDILAIFEELPLLAPCRAFMSFATKMGFSSPDDRAKYVRWSGVLHVANTAAGSSGVVAGIPLTMTTRMTTRMTRTTTTTTLVLPSLPGTFTTLARLFA